MEVDFISLVAQMREAQKNYFLAKRNLKPVKQCTELLLRSIALEKKVDELVAKLYDPGPARVQGNLGLSL